MARETSALSETLDTDRNNIFVAGSSGQTDRLAVYDKRCTDQAEETVSVDSTTMEH